MLKNEINVLKIKSKNQEDNVKNMKQEIEDLNNEHSIRIVQIKTELTNKQNLLDHYKGNI